MTQIERCKNVTNPIQHTNNTLFSSTSDYYNGCYIPGSTMEPVGVPNTVYGYQQARSGEGMAGIWATDITSNSASYREYVQLKFSNPLECGKKYRFKVYFNCSSFFKYSLKGLSFYFTEEELNDNLDYLYNLYEPIYIDSTTLVNDTVNWIEVSFEFIATKSFEYVSFGHANLLMNDVYFEVSPSAIDQTLATYFYVDDASLIEIESNEIIIPNVFTPNSDGVNDLFELVGNTAAYQEFVIFNRWGSEVVRLSCDLTWNGTINGELLPEAVYFYLLKPHEGCKNITKQGMIHLIR